MLVSFLEVIGVIEPLVWIVLKVAFAGGTVGSTFPYK